MESLRPLVFTPVELAFLASAASTEAGARVARAFLLGEPPSDVVLSAGYGSLVLRDWVSADDAVGGSFVESDVLGGIVGAFATIKRVFQLALSTDEAISSALILIGAGPLVLASTQEPGVVALSAFDSAAEFTPALEHILTLAIESGVSMVMLEETEVDTELAVIARKSAEGTWGLARKPAVGEAIQDVGADDIVAAVRDWVGDWSH